MSKVLIIEDEEAIADLEKKYDILRKGYNWFADYHFAKYRHEKS